VVLRLESEVPFHVYHDRCACPAWDRPEGLNVLDDELELAAGVCVLEQRKIVNHRKGVNHRKRGDHRNSTFQAEERGSGISAVSSQSLRNSQRPSETLTTQK
jgi:hypothetical protein